MPKLRSANNSFTTAEVDDYGIGIAKPGADGKVGRSHGTALNTSAENLADRKDSG